MGFFDSLANSTPEVDTPETQQVDTSGFWSNMHGLLSNAMQTAGEGGDTEPNPTPWEPVDWQPNLQFDTASANISGNPYANKNPDFGWDQGVTNTDKVDVSGINPVTREVTEPELVRSQLSGLLNSDSKFIQDARRQGLEQANAVGGLGGTVGVGASMQAAIRAALPIAESDAQAYRQAASENMTALNQFAQMSLQRATQLELGQLDARTRLTTQKMANKIQWSVSKLQDATQRDVSMLDANTRLRLQEMQGQIQASMADINYAYQAMLNDQQNVNRLREISMQGNFSLANTDLQNQWAAALTELSGEYSLANTALGGEWDLAKIALSGEWDLLQQQMNKTMEMQMGYMGLVTTAYGGYLDRLAELNGLEMDAAARQNAFQTITEGAKAMFNIINDLFPQNAPIQV